MSGVGVIISVRLPTITPPEGGDPRSWADHHDPERPLVDPHAEPVVILDDHRPQGVRVLAPTLELGHVDPDPPHIRTTEGVVTAIVELFERMAADTSSATDPTELNNLLAIQAHLLVKRLVVVRPSLHAAHLIDPVTISRFRDYRAAVDQHFRQWHLVTPYARHLGYSTKSLDRACRATSEVTAKQVIVERIILEARRILAHSSAPVARVSDDLGFDEPTNFVKYFKRVTNLTPTQFRDSLATTAQHSGA